MDYGGMEIGGGYPERHYHANTSRNAHSIAADLNQLAREHHPDPRLLGKVRGDLEHKLHDPHTSPEQKKAIQRVLEDLDHKNIPQAVRDMHKVHL